MKTSMRITEPRRRLAQALAVVMLSSSCTMHEVSIPEFDGPSETGISIALTASPDLLVADGTSTSLVTATVRGPDGRAVPGRDVFFTITDSAGRFADIGQFPTSNGPGTGVSVRTDGNGVARVTYQSPVRTDATANQKILIAARLMGNDAASETYRTVTIELRSAQPKLFPPNPNNAAPTCAFTMEAPSGLRTNTTILFQDASFDSDGVIVRYQWIFGDNTGVNYDPDTVHVYHAAGSYTVTHIVTDNNGANNTNGCTTSLTITN
jgi:PKD repeat protein